MVNKTTKMEQVHLAFGSLPTKSRDVYKPFAPGPNPDLPAFIGQHTTPYDAKVDRYNVTAFDRDIQVDKAAPPKAIYDMHTYWSKKHWSAIRQYIQHYLPKRYYAEGTGLVLDCFSGSGMTGVAAMMEARPCILIDASPAAAFISHCYTHPVDPDELQAAFERMLMEEYSPELKRKLKAATGEGIENLKQELDWLYGTKCDRCGGAATTEYVVYSERFQCPKCGEVIPLFDCPEVKVPYPIGGKSSQKTELKKRRVCPHCLGKHRDPHKSFVVSARTKKFGSVPLVVSYECSDGCTPKRGQRSHSESKASRKGRLFEECDMAKLKVIDKAVVPHWAPDGVLAEAIPYRLYKKMDFRPTDAQKLSHLFTKRNYWALAAILDSVRTRVDPRFQDALLLSFDAALFGVSRMVRESNTATMSGTYYLPQMSKEVHVPSSLCSKLAIARKGYAGMKMGASSMINVHNGPATTELPANSLDYIFTDPPYVDKIQYGELNYLWESWLGFSSDWRKNEVIVNQYAKKNLDYWDQAMRRTLSNCFHALKPGRWMSLCYHDTDPGTWTRLQDVIRDTGFEIHTVTVLDPIQKSQNQTNAEKIAKGDLVINCLKPRVGGPSGASSDEEAGQISQRVREIVIDTLSSHGGQDRDTLWNNVLKRLLTRGQMAEHRFDDILNELATRSESGRWFLKEEFDGLSEGDLRNEEEAGHALERFVRFRCMGVPVTFAARLALGTAVENDASESDIERYINGELNGVESRQRFKLSGRLKGCEFYDCLFFYLTRYLKGRGQGRTPRRNLADFLEEYLVRSRDGDKWLYRAPTGGEAASLKKSRQTGLGRRVRQFVSYLNGEGEMPKEHHPDAKTLVAWLKHCANFGLAEAGVTLFEKGGLMGQMSQLSEDERYDTEDYYAQCRRNAGKPRDDDGEAEGAATNGDIEGDDV